ncbi:RagB/SusD family nutrient uptake outer membrane protein [Chitinophaga qingshengii]|uniref:RagB/SusD family nutrient uptake outer membrane protein n=1 Tax=Chitinophaga qingshengii TaxID=1569794 RepID=A0ABR7THV9_9BACT|nr:RagB/SusD family nutrient uptake outer membrane protein [Chitinophaga qingshengii]MBC9929098.1 RagB/SusD family nutrient uptake outer membrane protein [Chitinophaga qingshengii]
MHTINKLLLIIRKLFILTSPICVLSACIIIFSCACNKFADVGDPATKITTEQLFKDDASATSSILGIYSALSAYGLNIIGGGATVCGSLTADELTCTNPTSDYAEFQNNAISTTNFVNQYKLWSVAYTIIYQTNICVEGLSNSTNLTPALKKQLLGEAKLVRSLTYFYLVQLFGGVPLITQSDYHQAAIKGRSQPSEVYDFIISDLTDAKGLLSAAYPSAGRLRPNSYTASALLAKVYLYTNNWQLAEKEANNVISANIYKLEPDLNQVFLAGSKEAIWQLQSVAAGSNTGEGSAFVNPDADVMPGYLVTDKLLNSFEVGDPRKIAWIGSKAVNGQSYYFPYKYKVASSASTTITENYVMFRLAEQYLIRAEAAIRQGKIPAGISDLNILRSRARGNDTSILRDITTNQNMDDALKAILQERQVELMAEWGNRWCDLKRFNKARLVLQSIKPGWKDTDTLYPIPDQEMRLNKNLTQNNGYN